jgi:hypothetical protein
MRKRVWLWGSGIALCIAGQVYLVSSDRKLTHERLDAPASTPEHVDGRPVEVKSKPGDPDIKVDEFGHELVPTGTSTIPFFPRAIRVPSSLVNGQFSSATSSSSASGGAAPAATPVSDKPGVGALAGEEEYTLLGLGIRTVSFLSIQVYVLGLYVRTSDLGKLQEAFVKHARSSPSGSSLIPSEKEALKKDLLDPEKSLEIWNEILRKTGTRSCVRIVPTRGTDFNHLRDGWVRGITARTQELSRAGGAAAQEYEDVSFGDAMTDFKTLLSGQGKTPKGSTVLLTRDEKGVLGVVYDHAGVKQVVGTMTDERVGRQVWLGYMAGKTVSSEGARASIVDGILDLVERPIGTISTGSS